jgi:hypothetical protein
MGIDDGPTDRQPHPHAAGFRGVEGFENALAAGPESRTATRTPFVWSFSALINNSRALDSIESIASTAFR